ncbi:hypothetical protein ABT304_08985 [Nocardioides sp. NPDC000445]|uniref:YobI family P-loop NTPase n=1 Tax=Nocardioides sp. NPDC000445 TaxID=3154257 RepID=UPI00331B7DCF
MADDEPTDSSRAGQAGSEMALLTPEFEESKHQLYVDRLKALIHGKHARNIAVAGQYSTGKSSVLDGLTKALETTKLRPITLSLSTIDADAARARVGGDAQSADTNSGIPAITSLIQNEIVKQLVYRKRPIAVPGSRFRRTEAFSPGRAAGWAAVAAVVAFGVVTVLPKAGPTVRGLLAAAAAALLVFVVLWRLSGRVSLQQLTAGPATLSLDTSKSYFDEYLDELMYFFDVSRCRVVIFEDIDRFNDPHIFETLRELNNLLNGADQLKNEKLGPIRFIYATRDSIFEINNTSSSDATPGGPGSPAADRTKFFDAVVPLVPFITHRTSRDHFSRRLGSEVSSRAIGIVAKYVTDMRLIVNICNELEVFKSVVLDESGLRNLRTDNLFAMVVHKNLYPGDFESITSGQSILDKVRDLYRRTVNDTAAGMERRITELRMSPGQSNSVEEHLAAAAARLRHTVEDILASHGVSPNPRNPPVLLVAGTPYTIDRLDQPEFWESAGHGNSQISLQIPGRSTPPFPRPAIERAFGRELPQTTVAETLRPDVEDEIRDLERDHRAVLSAQIANLFLRTDLTLDSQDTNFAEEVAELVPSPLTVELLRAGFLDAHFGFYVADYPALTMSPAAAEFEMTVIERFGFDPRFKLPQIASDLPALIESAGDAFLRDRRGYNLDIVDLLLVDDSDHLDGLMTALARGSDNDVAFIDTYLSRGSHQPRFLHELAGKWTMIFYFLATRTEADLETERAWLDAALCGSVTDVDYLHARAAERLERHASNTSAFTEIGAVDVAVLIHVTSCLRASLPNIATFAPAVRSAVIAAGLYRVNSDNLLAMAADAEGKIPALDELLAAGHGDLVVDHVLSHLSDYVNILKDNPSARVIADSTRYNEIIARLADCPGFAELDDDDARLLVERAPDGVRVDELNDVPDITWPALVASGRCRPSVANLAAYLGEYVDFGDWPHLLSGGDALILSDDDGQDARQRVALAVLAMDRLDPGKRVSIVEALDLEAHIPVGDLSAAAITLLPELTTAAVTADSGEVFEAIPADQVDVRRRFIAASNKLADFIEDCPLSDADALAVLDGGNRAAITKVLNRADVLRAAGEATIERAIEEARGLPGSMGLESLLALASGQRSAPRFAALLSNEVERLDAAELRNVLEAMPAPYNDLGVTEVELPESNRPLLDALQDKGVLAHVQKVRNRPYVRAIGP